MTEDAYTSIRVHQSTARKLSELGRKGESYDDLINWLLEHRKRRSLKSQKNLSG